MANLTPDQIVDAQAWIHDILVAGGIYAHPKRAVGIDDYYYMYGNHKYRDSHERTDLMSKAKELCDIIKNRKVDTQVFKQLTDLLDYFSNKRFYTPLGGTTDIRKNSNVLAKYLSWFCSEYEFLWDDSTASTYEMEIILNTAIGKTLKSFKCFTSQYRAPSKPTRTPKANVGNTNGAAGGSSNGQPQNDFKSRGALSNVAIDLLSTPNQKEYLSTPIYCVNGVDANGVVVEDTAYIRPVEADAKSQAKYTINNTNKVLFGKAKGYGYCQVYFTDKQAAEDFCMKVIASDPKVNSNVTLIKVCQLKKTLANGYFKIGTEFGPVYISASKLNESIQEAIQEAAKVEKQSACSNKEKWESFEEAYFHEM
jgi:3-methyladenine DNA glycosylase Mpg